MARVYISDESKKQGYLTRQREYMEYLKSPAWKQKRAEVMAVYENKCMNCGCSSEPLDVHHIRYAEVLGNETIKDFRVLCRTCHDAEHSASKKKKKSRKKNMHVRAA
jgi:5-methylcytosine-specific restriction endonuclease McrA